MSKTNGGFVRLMWAWVVGVSLDAAGAGPTAEHHLVDVTGVDPRRARLIHMPRQKASKAMLPSRG